MQKKNNTTEGVYLRALEVAIALKPDVISISFPLGKSPGDQASLYLREQFRNLLIKAIDAGIFVTLAAGNQSINIDIEEIYPTRYSILNGVISVGSRDYGIFSSKYSNFGSTYVNIAAPGLVFSSAAKTKDSTHSYIKSAGTSFSGPLVAAAASRVIQLLKHKNIIYTPYDVEKIIYNGSSVDLSIFGFIEGGKVLDLSVLNKYIEGLTQNDFPIVLK